MTAAKPLSDEDERKLRELPKKRYWEERLLVTLDAARARTDRSESALRFLSGVFDTLSPQEVINLAAEGLGADRHEYAGQVRPDKSLVEVEAELSAARARCAEMEAEINGSGGWRELCRGHERVISALTAERDIAQNALDAACTTLSEECDRHSKAAAECDALREQVKTLREALTAQPCDCEGDLVDGRMQRVVCARCKALAATEEAHDD